MVTVVPTRSMVLLRCTAEDMSGKVIMMDTPFMYMDDNKIHNWNNTLVLITGSYTTTDTQRWYATSGSNAAELYLHNAEVYGIGTNPNTGQQTGLQLGDQYDAMDISIKDTTLNPVATITSGMFYKSTWNNIDYRSNLYIDNATITHYKGYSRLAGAIAKHRHLCLVHWKRLFLRHRLNLPRLWRWYLHDT